MRAVKGRRKSDYRWKWMAGATAASAAAATSVQANSMVTVALTDNYISSLPENRLSANIFGNGDIFAFAATAGYAAHLKITTNYGNNGGGSALASVSRNMAGDLHFFAKIASAGGTVSDSHIGYGIVSVTKALKIRFSDPSVNGGALTDGLLQVTADARPVNLHTVRSFVILNSFSYNVNMPAAVPEGGSTLALLALGAGGVMAFRRRRKAV